MKWLNIPILFTISCVIILIMSQNSLMAQQSYFVISPPPIPWYEFNKGQVDLKPGGTFVSVTGDNVSLLGGGINLTSRYAFAEQFAGDFMFNYMYIGGDTGGGSSVDVHFLNWNPNFELQLIRDETYNMIIFAGYLWVLVPMTYWDSDGDAQGITVHLDGLQFGAQLSIKTGDYSIAPFFLFQSISGDALIDGYGWVSVPTQTVTTFGFDIVFIPYSITLSGLLQSISSDTDFTVIYFSVSRNFQWGGKERTVQDTAVKPEKETRKKTGKSK